MDQLAEPKLRLLLPGITDNGENGVFAGISQRSARYSGFHPLFTRSVSSVNADCGTLMATARSFVSRMPTTAPVPGELPTSTQSHCGVL